MTPGPGQRHPMLLPNPGDTSRFPGKNFKNTDRCPGRTSRGCNLICLRGCPSPGVLWCPLMILLCSQSWEPTSYSLCRNRRKMREARFRNGRILLSLIRAGACNLNPDSKCCYQLLGGISELGPQDWLWVAWGTAHLQELDALCTVGLANPVPPEIW